MSRIARQLSFIFASALFVGALVATAQAKDKVKVGFIGPLTGGVSANGLGGRNSADLAVKLRNADAKAKYEYELVVLDDECKPNVAVQVATKMAADKEIVAAATHYCSATAIATVDVPGANATYMVGINDGGQIVGDYDTEHGFVRANDGTITKFDFPGSTRTQAARGASPARAGRLRRRIGTRG